MQNGICIGKLYKLALVLKACGSGKKMNLQNGRFFGTLFYRCRKLYCTSELNLQNALFLGITFLPLGF